MLAAMLGLAAVLHTSALAFAALKWCGVVYLLYMSWQALRETGALSIDTAPAAGQRFQPARHRHGCSDQHPQSKLSIFFSPSCRSSSRPTRPIRWDGCWN